MIGLSSFIAFHARQAPNRCALKFRGDDISYGRFLERIETVGGWLWARGIRPDDVVAVLMKNSAAFLDIAFAVSHIGAVFLPINFRLSSDEVAYITRNAGARLLFVDAELREIAAGPAQQIVVSEEAQADATLLAMGGARIPAIYRRPSDLMRLMYTSGTTDRPKGVMLTYENLFWKSADQAIVLGLNRDTRLLVAGPLYHVGALDLPGIGVLWQGGMLAIQRNFDPEEVLATIQAERLTGAWLAPVMTTSILSVQDRDRYDVSTLQWVIGGGERTPESRIRSFAEYFTNARYIDAYGLTETCGGDTFMEPGFELAKIGSTGKPIAHVDLEIRDEAGEAMPAGVAGEICLRGPKVTSGYWRDPAKTEASFFGEWFRTGDIGYLDDDGFLYLTDRKKDMIISGGENIASSEVERVVYEMPAVSEVAVIGLPDLRWGERPVAVVTLAPGATLDLAELTEHCRKRLAPFKVPKQLIIRKSLPRNPSGKILKRMLRSNTENAGDGFEADQGNGSSEKDEQS